MGTRLTRPGRLVVYLGAAAGVGKTFAMLGEARLAVEDGVDLVIGYLEPHGRRATEDRARDLPRAPTRELGVGGRAGTELDIGWIARRRPSVVLIDELAHAYAEGDPPRRRYQDVAEILEHGIEVWTTVNVQHLESLGDRVRALTGVEVRETVPDRLIHAADELRLVDLAPAALRERIARGLVYPADRIEPALTGFFTVQKLTALRALVLHELAEVAAAQYAALTDRPVRPETEHVLVAVTGAAADPVLLREAARTARRVDGELIVLVIEPEDGRPSRALAGRLEDLAELGEGLGATLLTRRGDPVKALVAEAEAQGATRILLSRPAVSGPRGLTALRPLRRLLRGAPGVDVQLVGAGAGAQDTARGGDPD